MSSIRVLPLDVANQIAAGEVIERPASVVKELVENALDAGARRLEVSIEGGGRRRIVVADDGCGISSEELSLAFERHATSKLRSASDLEAIETLGFRGEALASIAAVSRVSLTSLSPPEEAGARVRVVAGRLGGVERVPFTPGTTVEVTDLFFNTPARRKFLKAMATETGHILQVVTRAAMPRPGLGLSLMINGRCQLECAPAPGLAERIVQLFGPERTARLLPASGKDGGVELVAHAGDPKTHFASRTQQHLFVNGRAVSDRSLSHAIHMAYEGLVPGGRFPAVFLFLTLDPLLVDVNVHPGKHEVRFADPRLVHELLRHSLRDALVASGYVPAFKPGPEIRGPAPGPWAGEPAPAYGQAASAAAEPAPMAGSGLTAAGQDSPQAAAAGPLLSGAVPAAAEAPAALKVLGQYRQSYILASDERGFLMVDQHAAHERILFERLKASPRLTGDVQRLLMPQVVELGAEAAALVSENREALVEAGIEIEAFGAGSFALKTLPASLAPAAAQRFLGDLLEGLAGRSLPRGTQARDRVLATVACHAAVKVNFPLTTEKMRYLLDELFACAEPYRCPHGRTAILRLDHETIERNFGRR